MATEHVDTRESRHLVVCEAYFRQYTPLSSGDQFHELHSSQRVMVAMLVPARYRDLVTYTPDNKCDVGLTMWKVVQHLGDEYAVELGGQAFTLAYEIHLARQQEESNMMLDSAPAASA